MSDRALTLFERFPRAAERRPWLPLCNLPTPVERLPVDTPSGVRLWIKRDDRTSAEYGGNKPRKLEFLLGEASARGCTSVWTLGAIGSHHCLATTLHGRAHRFDVRVLHFPQPVTEHVLHNVRAIVAAGAELELASRTALPVELARRRLRDWLSARGDGAYYIPSGGSSPIGVLGYVNAMLELAEQIKRGACPEPDRIYVPAGTCGTLAGICVGLALSGMRDVEVVGIRVVDRIMSNARRVRTLVRGACKRLDEAGIRVPGSHIATPRLVHEQFGEGYGEPTRAGLEAMSRFSALDGAPDLEPTYTAKTMAGLLADIERNAVAGDILYWHTFGGPAPAALVEAVPPDRVPTDYRPFFSEAPQATS